MGNIDCCLGGEANAPVTSERLEWAVRRMDAKEVAACLEAGVNANAPIDRHGHTIMDIFVLEHQNLLEQFRNPKMKGQEQTRLFLEAEESAAEVLKLLQLYRAKMSGRNRALRRGV